MQPMISMYVAYVALSVALTVWVGRTLHRNGRVFLLDVFAGNVAIADAVNQLLVVGFYLVNFGYVSLMLRQRDPVGSPESAVEALSWKIGLVLLVLGAMHFTNMIVLSKCRRRAAGGGGDRPRPAGDGHAGGFGGGPGGFPGGEAGGGPSSFGDVSFGRTPPSRWGFPVESSTVPATPGGSAVATAPALAAPEVPGVERLSSLFPNAGESR